MMKLTIRAILASLWIVVVLDLSSKTAVLAQASSSSETLIVDATTKFLESSESTFDHEVKLSSSLSFHWNDIDGNSFEGRLIHTATSQDDAPSWLGFGIYDTFSSSNSKVTPTTPLMVGSDAIVGIVANDSVEKYALDGKQVAEAGGVHPMNAGQQSLMSSSIKQHDSDEGTVTTVLSFRKLLEESDLEEVRVRHNGENVFLWAIGPPGQETMLAKHTDKGAFTLDFARVRRIVEGEELIDSNAAKNTSPVVSSTCGSELDPNLDNMVQLTPKISFHWKVNSDANPPTLSGMLHFDGDGWLGFGLSKDGNMIGSTAILGYPDSGLVQKYAINDKTVGSIVPMPDDDQKTLSNTSIKQQGGTTQLRFTKLLKENNDEPVITTQGLNTFIFAAGESNELGYHQHRGSFRVDLEACDDTQQIVTSWEHMGVFAAHGTLAVLAWGIAMPFALTVAWFRTLVPSSWIYIHVFANTMSLFFTFLAVITALAGVSMESGASHLDHPHHWIGILLLIIMIFQVVNGFTRPPVERKDNSPPPQYEYDDRIIKLPETPRQRWHLAHQVLGIAMLIMGIYQIVSGLNLFADNFNATSAAPWFWLYVVLFALLLLSLKAWIVYEERKARREMEEMGINGSGDGENGVSGSNDMDDDELAPVSFDRPHEMF